MKETFKAFKLEDGTYFEGYTPFEMLTTDKISSAYWFGYDGDRNSLSTNDMKNFKGKFVTVTVTDEELPTTSTDEDSTLPTLSMVKLASDYSEETIAYKIGVGKSTVHDWLHGKKPNKNNQKKLRDFIYKESTYVI